MKCILAAAIASLMVRAEECNVPLQDIDCHNPPAQCLGKEMVQRLSTECILTFPPSVWTEELYGKFISVGSSGNNKNNDSIDGLRLQSFVENKTQECKLVNTPLRKWTPGALQNIGRYCLCNLRPALFDRIDKTQVGQINAGAFKGLSYNQLLHVPELSRQGITDAQIKSLKTLKERLAEGGETAGSSEGSEKSEGPEKSEEAKLQKEFFDTHPCRLFMLDHHLHDLRPELHQTAIEHCKRFVGMSSDNPVYLAYRNCAKEHSASFVLMVFTVFIVSAVHMLVGGP